jgi:hypothetical protein
MYVNAKMIPVETIPGMRRGGDKEEQWRQIEFIIRTFVNSTCTPTLHNNKKTNECLTHKLQI